LLKGDQMMQHNRIVSQDEWLVARKQLLSKEKELTGLHDTWWKPRKAKQATARVAAAPDLSKAA
jgi:predicted dithiol-disulfide oxidoreductase (DUF899 family)